MSTEPDPTNIDPLGTKSIGDAILVTAKTATAFLEAICLPAAQEYGLWWRECVNRRRVNAAKLVEEAAKLMGTRHEMDVQAPPRLVAQILEHGSWCEEEDLRRMWAGLLASSCTEGGRDDTNVVFIDLLSRMTAMEVRYVSFAAEFEGRRRFEEGDGEWPEFSVGELLSKIGCPSWEMFRNVYSHLGSLGLNEVFGRYVDDLSDDQTLNLHMSELGFALYVRSQGWTGSVKEYFFS